MKAKNEKWSDNKEPKFSVFTLEDSDKNIKKYDAQWVKHEITNLSNQWQSWVEAQKNNEQLQAKIRKWKQGSDLLLKKTTQSVKAFCENEEVQKKLCSGKDKVLTTSMNVAHFLQEGIQETLEQENIKRAVYNVHQTMDRVRNDHRVKKTVKQLKKEMLQMSESAYYGIKKVLEEKEVENKDTTEENKL